jgi:hypothetical protein
VDALDDGDEGPAPEPYFERDLAGRRVKHLPDIRQHLGGSAGTVTGDK